MPKNKIRLSRFFHLPRFKFGKSNQQQIPSSASAPVLPAEDDSGHEATHQVLSSASSITAASNPTVPERPTFSNVLESSRPSGHAEAESMGKMTWIVFKRILEVAKESSDPCPPLKGALGGLLRVLEQYETMKDSKDDFSLLSQKIKALELIVTRYNASDMPESVKDRLKGVSDWIESVTTSIEAQKSHSHSYRFFHAEEDRKMVLELLQSLTWVIDLFMLDTNIGAEKQIGQIEKKIDNLADNTFLDRLRYVEAAGFIAQRGDFCLKGTRILVIASILRWCADDSGPPVYWLCGMAGTGKSAITRTICNHLLENLDLLGGSFFCSRRATAEEQDIRRIIPTLAWQLSLLNESYKLKLVERLKKGSDIIGAAVERQLEELIIKPSQESTFPRPLILVIDALDEGSRADDTAQLLKAILGQVAKNKLPLKFFVTSRPESHIRSQFMDPLHASEYAKFHLQNIEESVVRADIRLYVTHRLEKIKKVQKRRLPMEWPSESQTDKLVDRADKLFIYAFTACNYIQRDPHDGLHRVIEAASGDERPVAEKMDEIYGLVLDEASNPSKTSPAIISTIRRCLTVLIYVRQKFSLSELAAFIGTDIARLENAVDELHSLILLPSIEDEEISTLHASFGDYLANQRRSERHFIDREEANLLLLKRCFQIMDSELQFNVAQARTSFLSNEDQELALPKHLSYAAVRWRDHVTENDSSAQSTAVTAWIEMTLLPKFLFWLEVISIAKVVDAAIDMLQILLSFAKTRPDLMQFINDGIHFIHESKTPISQSVPHIYLSALAFCQKGSIIRDHFCFDYSRIAQMEHIGRNRSKTWELCLIGHTSRVTFVAVSPDGTRIVSGSSDNTVRVWDAQTGQPTIPPLEGHTRCVNSVAFSPDGTRIVSGSDDNRVRVWDVQTGQPTIPPLEGHTRCVNSVAFSSDGTRIVSGSDDNTVRVWDVQTGQPTIPPLEGHTHRVNSVAFSPDGTRIVSGSSDNTVRVWDVQTGQPTIPPLEGHTHWVNSVAFSPDGTRIVSGSLDNTVRVWDVQTGQPTIPPLEGHTDWVNSVAFSPDGTRIVSGSLDNTVRVWDAQTGQPTIPPLEGHTDCVRSVAFSPDGTRIVSGSDDNRVRVWDVQTGQPTIPPLEGHTDCGRSVAFSPDGTRIVSGSSDNTVRVWDAQTNWPVIPSLQRAVPSNRANIELNVVSDRSITPLLNPFSFPFGLSYIPPFHSNLDVSDPRDIFSFNRYDGWIRGPDNELFLWIPEDMRFPLYLPRIITIISQTRLCLDLSNFACGEDWVNCYQPRSLVNTE